MSNIILGLDDSDIRDFAEDKQAVLASIVDSSDDAIISKTLNGIITSWNKAATKMFGYTEAEAIGKHISLIIPPERIDEEDKIIAKVKSGERIEHFNTVRINKSGNPLQISLTVSPIRNSAGTINGASKIARDISALTIAEEKQAMLAAIVESSDDAIISKTLLGFITSWNNAAVKMFGYTEQEAIGKHITMLIPKERLSEEDIIINKITSGEQLSHFETYRVSKDGKIIPISLTVSPIKNSAGKVIGASKIARNIAEELENREKIKLYNQQLEKINSYKDEFIGMASHELKTPLTSISGYLQLLELSQKDEKTKQFLLRAVNQTKKLSALVSDLLDISKIQQGKLPLHFEHFVFDNLLEEVVNMLQDTISSHEIVIEKNTNGLSINADKQRIEQVIVNLVSNAVKYSPKANKVVIKTWVAGNFIRTCVTDYGIGIRPDQHDKIFSRFYRVEGTGPAFSGLGIGLFISKEIIVKHSGKLWLESEPEKGSTFYFELPQ